MAMPANTLSPLPAASAFLEPDDRVRTSLLVDYEMGGADIGDPSQGLQVKAWEARVSAGTIQVRPDGSGAWTNVVSDTGITEIALAFDQNMRPTVAYVAGGAAKLYWYDAVTAAYVTTTYAGASSPVVTMDDKRDMQVGLNDVLLFYLHSGRVKHRRQRDRYTIEYDLADVPLGKTRITRWGFTAGKRIQLEFGNDPEPVVIEAGSIGTFYTDLRTDTLYAVDGTDVVPFFDTGKRVGLWRSGKFVLRAQPSFAWARINGPGSIDATLRLLADGVEVYEVNITDRDPVRLPAVRGQIWEVEIEGEGIVTSLSLASSAAELR